MTLSKQQVLNSLPMGVVVVEASGRTKFANEPARSLLGDSLLLDGPWRSRECPTTFHHPGTGDELRPDDLPVARALRGEAANPMNVVIRRGSDRVPALMSAAPIRTATNEVAFVIVTVQDVSEEQRLEAQTRQAQRLLAVGRLAGGVAHDFNNVLTSIFSFLTYAMERIDPDDPAYGDLQHVMKAAGKGADLTQQLLAFSRRTSPEARVISPNEQIESIERMLEVLGGKDIQLVINLSDDVPNVRLRGGSIDQVLMNLAVNARDAMPEGGRLTIETSTVTLTDSHVRQRGLAIGPGRYVKLSVRDEGTGMDEETRRQVFDPFFTTKPPGSGTGLGLSTCWGIVQQSDGHIAVESAVGVGTTIDVYLPAVEEAVTKTRAAKLGTVSGRGEMILVVDDEIDLLDVIERSLDRHGFKVLTAVNGVDAMEVLEGMPSGSVDLVLTDVRMPRIDGIELAKYLGANRPEIGVLFMSAYTDDLALRDEFPDAQMLAKPFRHPDEVAAKVREVLGPQPTQRGVEA